MKNEIEKIIKELDSDSKKMQISDAFNEKELEAIKKAKKVLGFSKSRAIAIACEYLVEKLEEKDKNEEQKDDTK